MIMKKRLAIFGMYLSRCSVVLTNLILWKTRVHARDVNCRLQNTLSNFYFSRSLKHTICDCRYRHRDQDAKLKIKKVYFFWICPDTNAFEWFSDLLQSLEQQVRTEYVWAGTYVLCRVCVYVCVYECVDVHVRVRFYKFMFVFAYQLGAFMLV